MGRDRSWRRHIENKKVIKRLKQMLNKSRWWRFEDACNIKIQEPKWHDLVVTKTAYFYKCSTTSRYDTRCKTKWGKKGKKNYDWSFDQNTRPKDRKRYKKELDELGLKHIPTQFGWKLED